MLRAVSRKVSRCPGVTTSAVEPSSVKTSKRVSSASSRTGEVTVSAAGLSSNSRTSRAATEPVAVTGVPSASGASILARYETVTLAPGARRAATTGGSTAGNGSRAAAIANGRPSTWAL